MDMDVDMRMHGELVVDFMVIATDFVEAKYLS